MSLLLRNARQMKRIVEATYPSLNFEDEPGNKGEECEPPLVCQSCGVHVLVLTTTERWTRLGM